MLIEFVNKQIMDEMLESTVPVKYAQLEDGSYIFSSQGFVAYVLQESEIYFSLAKCMHRPESFKFLQETAPKVTAENQIIPTLDVRVGKHKVLLTRMQGPNCDTFVDVDLLEAFDYPTFYQDKPLGIITVTEGPAERRIVRGYVMPARTGLETAGHYNETKEAQKDGV